ncbi:Sorting nexin-19 [Chionoecetes opilio]|uniref:Sorting nexin-19 n=1 Tax=Chionoecetes opilio TaxID=41210 RepID=A0A8J4Y8X0_CHIOP|nr:Sorting nexin-19 [Chionoecetes opilio]
MIKDVLEEMLGDMCCRVQESSDVAHMAASILQIYLQHYRQYQRALKKVSKKHKDFEVFSRGGLEELQAKYKPLHPALKSQESLKHYYRKLSQALLLHYLPVEVTRCDLILISLRDLFAQNVLQAFVDLLCDTLWLNTALTEILSGGVEDVQNRNAQRKRSSPKEENMETLSLEGLKSALQVISDERMLHTSLPAIEEETLSELQQLFPVEGLHAQRSHLTQASDSPGNKEDDKKFENAEELVEYVRSSSLEKKESSEDEDYKSVSSALGTLISTTAGPLLPDSSSPPYAPLVSKMWESPVEDKCFVDIPPVKRKKNLFSRNVVEGMKEEEYKLLCRPTTDEKTAREASSPASIADNSLVPKLDEISQNSSIEIKIEDSDPISKEPNEKTLVPNLRDIPRSKSCGNLVNGEEGETLGVETKILHSSLGKLDQVEAKETKDTESSDSFDVDNDDITNRKEKGYLVKMLSFDKNDGTDETSLQNEKLEECELEKPSPGECLRVLPGRGRVSPSSASPEHNHSPTTASTVTPTKDTEPPGTLEIPDSPPLGNAGFGWENPDLSPIYEESDDLAASIAKLRSLLTERESQHSLGSLSSYGSSDSEPKSAQSDPGRYSLEKGRFTFTHKDSSGSLASVKSVSSLESCGNGTADEDLLEAAEIPLDGRVFLSVCVPSTEVHTEAGGTQYTLYTIQYDAIYLCETPTITEGEEEGASEPAPVSEPRMVLQTNCVKRRFREFLTLHAALEDDTRLRAAMKGVKAPNKWLNLPFSKLDSTTIATRKQFLEKYLQSVIQRPEVNISTPVKEFLAYGSDASISFVKKPLELNVPRLDKLFAKTMSGVFHSLKTALPSFESSDSHGGSSEGGSNSGVLGTGSGGDLMLRTRSGGGILIERNKLAAFLSSGNKGEYELKLDITAEEEDCQIEASIIMEVSGTHHELVDTAYEAKETRSILTPDSHFMPETQHQHHHSVLVGCCDVGMKSPVYPVPPYLPPPGPRPPADGCDDDDAPSRRSSNQDSINEEDGRGSWDNWPLSVGVLEVVVELLGPCDHPITRQPCVTLLIRTFAKIAHKWLQAELEHLFSESNSVEYIQTLRETILGSLEAQTPPPPSFEEVRESREKLKGAVKDFIPGMVQVLLGREVTQGAAMRVVDSLQHPPVMTDLGLHLLDLLASQLLPGPPPTP